MSRLARIALAASLGVSLTVSALVEPVAAAPSAIAVSGSYTVVVGDYLAGIAVKLNVSFKDLLAVNGMTSASLILPGQQLKVPANGKPTATTTTVAKPAAAPAPSAPLVYTVVKNDFLTGIAGKLKVSIADLLKVNQLSLNSLIYPGMQLTVPAGGALPAAAPTPTAPATPAAPAAAPLVYTVVAGDSLSGIAGTLGVKLSSLLATNQLSTSSLIQPGMTLRVPAGGSLPQSTKPAAPAASTASYIVVSGDTLAGIAGKLGVTLPALLTTNQLTVSSLIVPGMALTVPTGGRLPTASTGSPVSTRIATVLAYTQAQLGKPYRFNTAGPDTFDCSGLTLAAYRTIGIDLPHYSGAQFGLGTVIDWTTTDVQPGDLVFLESAPGSGIISHVGIATSATTWIHAPRAGDVVRSGNIPFARVVGVRRFVNG